ncbi:MAG: mannose-1-phosphate guanylyltransferase [Thermomicrobiales bacterium]|nr:mannose-1-phosphate guanylyltransferase [Thermomicrobiales bacterium]
MDDGETGSPVAGSFWAVIPAGGSGTRLWPLSRAAKPKFLLPLLGDRSLLQQTVDRLGNLAPIDQTLVICGPAHAVAVGRQLPTLPESRIVVEPAPKGSGPAIALAAAIIARHDPDAVMGSFAADHDVRDQAAFEAAVRTGIAAARAGDWLVTIGLTPSRPETGYGYIERSDQVVHTTAEGTAYRALRFVEKPDLARATEYVASGRFAWNASIFIWRVQTLLDQLAIWQPELLDAVTEIAAAWDTPAQDEVLAPRWSGLASISIDEGVMEQAPQVAVVPAVIGWSDVGDWHGLGELIPADDHGNSLHGPTLPIDSERNVLWSETDRPIVTIGLNDTIVVDTGDAVLVAPRTRAQDVRRAVDALKARGKKELV